MRKKQRLADFELSVADCFVLSLLDRGSETTYDLQQDGGLSQGTTIPVLRRLSAAKLITPSTRAIATKRLWHGYKLTPAGKQHARNSWKEYFKAESVPSDLDAALRVLDMAEYYQPKSKELTSFLWELAASRSVLHQQLIVPSASENGRRFRYVETSRICNTARLEAEARALAGMAESQVSRKLKETTKKAKH